MWRSIPAKARLFEPRPPAWQATAWHRLPPGLVVAAACLLVAGCGKREVEALSQAPLVANRAWFEDVTDEMGLDFVHDCGNPNRYFMPIINGSGAAIFDIDNDGRLDIYLAQAGGPDSDSPNRLFRQTADSKFEDVSAGSGLDVKGYGQGVAAGDVNNDGWTDVFLTEYGRARLFVNQGNGQFAELTREAGIENPHWGCSASFLDFDRDGWLDVVVANYVDYSPAQRCFDQAGEQEFCGPSGFPPTIARLFRNLGQPADAADQQVRFEDVTVSSGLSQVPGPGLGVVCADFDGDRWQDILFADDGVANRLWINQRNGTFKEEAAVRGIAYNAMGQSLANMGVALGDADGDGQFDIFIAHLNTQSHTLWRQEPRGMFWDHSTAAGVTPATCQGTAFGTILADFDDDGALDLALATGRIQRMRSPDARTHSHRDPFWSPYALPNQLLANDGKGHFTDVSPRNPAFCGTPSVARGLACADIDSDGAMDLLVTNIGSAARLYRNVAANRGHWLIVRVTDPELGGRDAYGAEITVEAPGWRAVRWLSPSCSFLCSNDPRCHFGLGPRTSVRQIHVVWPDGTEEVFDGASADQVLVLRKGAGRRLARVES